MGQETFEIKTDAFTGPLDLLLSLIEKRKLLINDISLAQVTDDYISYLKTNGEMSLKQNAHFILVASTLLLIKSKSLLPQIDLSDEETQSIEDLERRLKIFKRVKEIEPIIAAQFFAQPSFTRCQTATSTVPVFAPSAQITILTMTESIRSVISALPKVEKIARAVVTKVISLEEMITRLTTKIKQSLHMSFREFSHYEKKDKIHVIVSFLAMLELVKEGIIDATQGNHEDDINIQTKEFDTPHYV